MDNGDKQVRYNALVNQRKHCEACNGLVNPHKVEGSKYDTDQIGPWSKWQGNLDAEIMVVGQDWGDVKYFIDGEGVDKPSNPTNMNLKKLLLQFGISIQQSVESHEQSVFLTNMILCLKDGGLQAPVENALLSNCAQKFFRQLVEIVSPKIVMALGKNVSEAILDLYDIPHAKSWNLQRLMQSGPFSLSGSTYLFPVYHCGAGGVNRNRPLEDQMSDWKNAAKWYKGDNSSQGQGIEHKSVEIGSSDYWFKVVGFLQQNWALIEKHPDSEDCTVFFIQDASGVFDHISFSSVEIAVHALNKNGFARYADSDEAQKSISSPQPPFFEEARPIYSSGEFWR